MAAWKYIGYCNWRGGSGFNYLWTNGVDIAWLGSNRMSVRELDDLPHIDAQLSYGALVDEYDGDVLMWLRDIGGERDTLQSVKERTGLA